MTTNTLRKLQAHLVGTLKTSGGGFEYKKVLPRVKCADGSTMSVQASKSHYCTPRSNTGPYTHVEVWCCGDVPQWNEQYGGGDDPYAQVPVELVAEEIDRRGGFAPVLTMLEELGTMENDMDNQTSPHFMATPPSEPTQEPEPTIIVYAEITGDQRSIFLNKIEAIGEPFEWRCVAHRTLSLFKDGKETPVYIAFNDDDNVWSLNAAIQV